MPSPPTDAPVSVVPDWICEIFSPSTKGYDMLVKRRFYAEIGVRYLWYIDPEIRTLMVSKLVDGRWTELGIHGEQDKIRAEPFAEIEISLGDWWEVLDAQAKKT